MTARSYAAWVGGCVALALLWLWPALYRPSSNSWSAVEIFAGAAVLLAVALRGIRVRIKDGALEYRNML